MHSISIRAASRARAGAVAAIILATAAACSSAAPAASAPAGGSVLGASAAPSVATVASASTAADTATATDSPTAAPTQNLKAALGSGPTGVPTSLDPCQLVTSAQASALAGTQFGPGRGSTTSGNARICTYGGATTNVFMVEVVQAPSVAEAQAEKSKAEAEANSAVAQFGAVGLQLTQIPNLADGAAMLAGSKTVYGRTLDARGIYVLKGAVFFAMSDVAVGSSAPSASAMQAAAQEVIAKLP